MRALIALVLGMALFASVSRADAPAPIRRVAFIVGANDGGREHVRLHYAESDALAFDAVLERLGGVSSRDRLLLLSPDKRQFLAGLDQLGSLLQESSGPAKRTELVVYYSGHSDDEGLLLGEDKLTYSDFRKRIESLPADVRIAILDSCASGAMTRHKGGTWRPPFMVDDSSQVQGHAILTSSAENEAAQESDRIGGSFFTHFLVSGLRGAADMNRDGRVTLNEGYQFAFNETLARTEQTQSGAQHPAFDIQLSGSGDLVMTDLRGSSAHLVVDSDVDGRVFVRDAKGTLSAELRKTAGRQVELGLEPGAYQITVQSGDALFAAKIEAQDGGRATLTKAMLQPVRAELAVARGGKMVDPIPVPSEEPEPNLASPPAAPKPYVYRPLTFSLLPSLCRLHDDDARVISSLALSVAGGDVAVVRGVQVGIFGAFADESVHGLQFSPLFSVIGDDDKTGEGGLHGVQLSMLVNTVLGYARGFQLSLAGNFAFGEGPMLHHALTPDGHSLGQLAIGMNDVRGPFTGLQGAVGLNVIDPHPPEGAEGTIHAVQLAVGGNLAKGDLTGVQLAVGANLAGGRVSGLQFSTGLNLADGNGGAQIGLVNISGDVTGVQAGLVNIAHDVKGVQLGLVNVSHEIHGVPAGLVNYSKEGLLHLQLSMAPNRLFGATLQLGSKWFYSLGTFGLDLANCETCTHSNRTMEGLLGLGVRIPLSGWIFVSADASLGGGQLFADGPVTFVAAQRLLLGLQPFEHLGAFAGLEFHQEAPPREPLAGSVADPAWHSFVFGLQI